MLTICTWLMKKSQRVSGLIRLCSVCVCVCVCVGVCVRVRVRVRVCVCVRARARAWVRACAGVRVWLRTRACA
jgi:hypothetical protein